MKYALPIIMILITTDVFCLECTAWAGDESVVKYEEGKYRIIFKRDWEKVDYQIVKSDLYVIRFCPMSSGCKLFRYDAKGQKVFETGLEGIGTAAHSKYSNNAIFYNYKDKVIIIGNESHGRYYEERSVKDGSLIINRVNEK